MLALKTCALHLGEAAIDKQLRPRHVARIIRCEKHYCFGDLIRLSEPSERYYIGDHLQPLLSGRHDAFAAVWGISSQCAICAKTEHAIDVVGIVGSEELLGGRYVVFRVPFHLYAPPL